MWSGDSAIEVPLERRPHATAGPVQALARGVLRKLEHLARFAMPAPRDVAQRDDRALLDRQRRDRAFHRAAGAVAAPDVVGERAPVARVRAPVPREGAAAVPKALGVDR